MRIILLVLLFLSASSNANLFFNTFDANDVEVLTPSSLRVTITERNEIRNGVLTVRIDDVDFGLSKNADCINSSTKDCSRLNTLLSNSSVKINLHSYNYKDEVYHGDIFVDGQNLSYYMIKNGWYKFDYKQSRSKHLVLMQKEAMCKGLGIWAISSQKIDEMCN
ncbi:MULTISPECIES: thermonuclease family protein [Pseudoalteromonas]|uniref:thermonuclease family protein n=1 Tax=Pseudoalteromonas TaxID=53246 RepID=UPI0015824E82|nr:MULTISPECIES: hypothetical protein [Pseudoalteromonas]MDI4652639.1 hypothetical protein [Pseudoalteromonas shioyasakiensis]NUJ38651.1 hypothetical protein [Pseudoalteromonas sp. 0303]